MEKGNETADRNTVKDIGIIRNPTTAIPADVAATFRMICIYIYIYVYSNS